MPTSCAAVPAAAAYLSPGEVADRLGLAKAAPVLAWIHAGELPAVNVGTGTGRPTYRVALADLDAFLERRRAVPAARPERRARRKHSGTTRYSDGF